MTAADFARIMPDVARHFWGEPTHHHSTPTKLRWGTNGARCVDVGKGTWFDHEAKEGGGVVDLLKREGVADWGQWLHENGFAEHRDNNGAGGKRTLVAIYNYTDEQKNLLFQVLRLNPKTFRQRRPARADDSQDRVKNGWVWSVKGVRHVPFRLPELIEARALKHRLFVVEGEKDVLTLAGHGIPATCNAGGAHKWDPTFADYLAGADVVVIPDNDKDGHEHAQEVASSLAGKAARIRILDLPGLPEKGDVSDWFAAGGTVATFNQLLEAAADWKPEAGLDRIRREHKEQRYKNRTNGASKELDARSVIRLEAGKYHEIAEAAEIAIMAAGLPLFDRGGILVTPVVAKAPGADRREIKTVALMQVTEPLAREFMGRAAVFERFDARTNDWVKTKPPRDIAELMLVRRGRWPFQKINGVFAAPTLRSDGTLLAGEGYDAATGLYVLSPPDMPPIPEQPTRADAVAALELLDELLHEFPWCDSASRAVGMSALITPVARPAFSTAPLHAFTAPDAGTGKSFLADLGSAIATGYPCAVQAQGANEEEDEKRIVATLIAGYPIMSIDNCTKPLRGAALCQLVERPLVEFRVLGKSMKLRVEPCITVFATGNNLVIAEDLTRRSVVARLDAGMEQPYLREFKRNPLTMIMESRGRYVAAALTVVRAYQVAGRPDRLPPFASFNGWSDCVRSALVWVGCADPVITTQTAHQNDPNRQQAGALFEAWARVYGAETEKRASEIAGTTDPDLREALLDVADDRGQVSTQKLGYWLRDHADFIVDGHRLERRGSATRPSWCITTSSQV
jgi:putative DNA primase/helicase